MDICRCTLWWESFIVRHDKIVGSNKTCKYVYNFCLPFLILFVLQALLHTHIHGKYLNYELTGQLEGHFWPQIFIF